MFFFKLVDVMIKTLKTTIYAMGSVTPAFMLWILLHVYMFPSFMALGRL